MLGQPSPPSSPGLPLLKWAQDRADDYLYGASLSQQIGLGALAVGLGGGGLYAQYELTGQTQLSTFGLLPKVGLGGGAKLAIDPSITLDDDGLWTGGLKLGIKDWNPFPNPAVTVALNLDETWDSGGGYTLNGSLEAKLKLNQKITISGGCGAKTGPQGSSFGLDLRVNLKY